jgi:hypothetical protein
LRQKGRGVFAASSSSASAEVSISSSPPLDLAEAAPGNQAVAEVFKLLDHPVVLGLRHDHDAVAIGGLGSNAGHGALSAGDRACGPMSRMVMVSLVFEKAIRKTSTRGRQWGRALSLRD